MIVEVKPSQAEELWISRSQGLLVQIYTCHKCGAYCSYPGQPIGGNPVQYFKGVWADTEGPAFKAYLCFECKDKIKS